MNGPEPIDPVPAPAAPEPESGGESGGPPRWATLISRGSFTFGILASTAFLATGGRLHWPLIFASISTAAHLCVWRPPRRMPRAVTIAAWTWLVLLAVLLGYATLMFCRVLWWAIEPALIVAAVLSGIAALATAVRPWGGVRISMALASGLCLGGALRAWPLEEGRIRCDDFIAVTAQDGVTLVSPSRELRNTCSPGAVAAIGRFPRKVYESPSGERLFITSQQRGPSLPDDTFEGSMCNISLESGEVSCVEVGTSYGFAPAPELHRVYVANHHRSAEIVALDEDTLEILARSPVPKAVHAWYDPEAGEVGVFTDTRGAYIHRAEDLAPIEERDAVSQPDRLYYDHERDEGLMCFASGPGHSLDGEGYLALAFETSPFRERGLGNPLVSRFALSWGCGWDPKSRRVYAGITTLGLLVEIDYDSGDMLGANWVGPGTRPIEVDTERGLIYVGYFFNGRVVALREDGSVAHEWFAGRFVRDIQIARDRRSLWVTSNLGVLRLELPDTL